MDSMYHVRAVAENEEFQIGSSDLVRLRLDRNEQVVPEL